MKDINSLQIASHVKRQKDLKKGLIIFDHGINADVRLELQFSNLTVTAQEKKYTISFDVTEEVYNKMTGISLLDKNYKPFSLYAFKPSE